MASRRQRRRRHEAAVEHQRQQRARLRSALDELPAVVAPSEMHRLMGERGYEQDPRTGIWKRRIPLAPAVRASKRGPSWAGILAERKRKKG